MLLNCIPCNTPQVTWLYFLGIHACLKAKICTHMSKKIQVASGKFHGIHVPQERVASKARWESWVWYRWIALIDRKVRWNTDECATAFQYSDWLYLQWPGWKQTTSCLIEKNKLSHNYCFNYSSWECFFPLIFWRKCHLVASVVCSFINTEGLFS